MLRHNLLIIFRNFKRFKTTFFINLVGLSSGLACAIFIYLWVADELAMDRFHQNDDQLFIVMTNQNRPDDIVTLEYGPGQIPDELAAEMPEVEFAVGSSGIGDNFTLSVPGKNIAASGQFAGEHFFTIFSYPLVHGDKHQVLKSKNGIVLSEKMAKALFNTTDHVVGKMVGWQIGDYRQQFIVTGIFKDTPSASSQHFDFTLSYELYKELIGGSLSWGNHNAITYLQLKNDTNIAEFNKKIGNFIKQRDPGTNLTIFVKPYSDSYLFGKYENGKLAGGRVTYVRLFSAIALFILLIACINFMNLATAKASRRIKEVGIKKAIGAARSTLILQYLAESLFMAFLSMAIAVLLVDILLPQFNAITGKHLSVPFEGRLFFGLLIITLITGVVAGSYPAIYLSRFSPAVVLKGKLHTAVGEQWARQGLVVFQFVISIIFIVAVWVILKQMEYVQTKNLGLDKDHVISFKMEGAVPARFESFLNEVKTIPGVREASVMNGSVMGQTSFTTGSFGWKGRDPEKVIQFQHLGVYFDLIELLGLDLADGRSFSRQFPSDTSAIILNETAINVMGLKDPVGEKFNLWGRDYNIIGVLKDFHFESLHNNVKPLFLRITRDDFDKVMVKLEAGREKETISRINDFYKKFNPGYQFDYRFLDEEYQAQYVAEERVATLSKYFAGLAILISCLGLFGLAAFTAERRLKEIGIRKVLGASATGILHLLSSDFNKIVLLAIAIALPVSFLAIDSWLETFAYRIALQWWYFAGAGLTALLIAWLTVSMHAWRAARINPVKCLRDE